MPELFESSQEMIKPVMIYVYLLFINLAGFILIAIDKKRAVKKRYRIPEKIIFVFALLGGGIGIYFSMFKYRHKTLHKRFTIGIPIIILIQFVVLLKVLQL